MAGVESLKSSRAWRMQSEAWASALRMRTAMAISSALAGTMEAIWAMPALTNWAISSGSLVLGGGTSLWSLKTAKRKRSAERRWWGSGGDSVAKASDMRGEVELVNMTFKRYYC